VCNSRTGRTYFVKQTAKDYKIKIKIPTGQDFFVVHSVQAGVEGRLSCGHRDLICLEVVEV
jgi:acetone carboxylase gamma subunit